MSKKSKKQRIKDTINNEIQYPEQIERYKKTLELLINSARDEYKQYTIDWRNRHSGLIKTYLWIAVTLIASELHIFSSIWNKKPSSFLLWHIEPTFLFYFFAILALITSFFVFILGIDTLRGRGGITSQFTKKYSDFAIQHYEEVFENMPITLYSDMLVMIDIAIYEQRMQIKQTAYKLRIMSYTLLVSIIFSILATFPYNLFQ